MDMLTTDSIENIINDIRDEDTLDMESLVIHPTTIAYIQARLRPVDLALGTALEFTSPSSEDLIQIVGELFPEFLENFEDSRDEHHIVIQSDDIRNSRTELQDIIKTGNMANLKSHLIKELVKWILGGAIYLVTEKTDHENTLLPWDVQMHLGGLVDNEPTTLPVTVIINGVHNTHEMSLEFAMGLLLFSDQGVGDYPINASIYDVPFTSNYIIQDPNRFHYEEEEEEGRGRAPGYVVTVGLHTYEFQTTNFMQGFVTGAIWAGVDHHKYWHDLIQFSWDMTTPKWKPVFTPLSF
jgi:hypothetical protein